MSEAAAINSNNLYTSEPLPPEKETGHPVISRVCLSNSLSVATMCGVHANQRLMHYSAYYSCRCAPADEAVRICAE